MSCETCYAVSLPDCSSSIEVRLSLLPNTSYKYKVTDKFSNTYTKAITTDGSGTFTIAATDFPKGLFTRFSGVFRLSIYTVNDDLQEFLINTVSYGCVAMSFDKGEGQAIIPDPEHGTLPAPNPETVCGALGSCQDFTDLVDRVEELEQSGVQSVTGLDTDNTDPRNPILQIAVDGVTVTGEGTPANPLVASGVTQFVQLTDAPASYTGAGGKAVVVKATEDGLEFATSGVQSVTGLDTDNTDPSNPVIQIAVDGTSITGDGTSANPLVATALTKGNLTESTSSVLTITGGTNAVIGTGTTIQVQQASSSQGGYLSSTDWSTFNSKQAAGTYATGTGTANGTNTGDETASSIGAIVNGAAGATPNDTDLVATVESSVVKKITWANAKTFLKTYFDAIYTTTAAVASQITTALSGYVPNSRTVNAQALSADITLTTAHIADSTNKRYLTDAQQTVVANTSGTNTGDETTSTIKTKLSAASYSSDGYLTATDWSTFNGKQNALTNPVTGTGTTNELTYFSGSSVVSSLSTATYPSLTELSYVKGLTSGVQAQINGKEATLTKGNLSETTSSVLTITGGTGAVIGSGATIQVKTGTTANTVMAGNDSRVAIALNSANVYNFLNFI